MEDKSDLRVQVALLTPNGDKLNSMPCEVPIIQGPEEDVLSRYVMAARHFKPDYMVRITSDCPEIPSPLISKHIFTAVNHDLDYMSNVIGKCRTYPDGYDCEVISARLLKWVDENSDHIRYREHVTSILQEHRPDWCRMGHCIGYTDNSHLKLSVDEQEDLDFIRMYVDLVQSKMDYAKNTAEVVVRW